MSFKDLFLNNLKSETHLRDARHAQQIYNQNNFAFTPKTKHMYHVRFEFDPDVGNSATSNAFKFQKELSLLVKSADLPSFRASVENKQQYNRKKNIQTRVDYQDVRIGFHDDNTGVTRALLEEYYRYYFVDALKLIDPANGSPRPGSAFNPRDKYFGKVPVYGLDNDKTNPFFKYITIYQLSRREWFAYTLVNPLLTAWDHGSVQSDGSEFNENTISVAYEAVQYTTGSATFDTPAGFADASVGYDVTPSPLGYIDNTMNGDFDTSKGLLPALIGLGTSSLLQNAFGNKNTKSKNILKEVGVGLLGGLVTNILSQNKLPVADSQNVQISSTSTSSNSRVLSSAAIVTKLSNPAAVRSIMPALINSGAIANVGITEYNAASASQQGTYNNEVISKIEAGDKKLTQIASNAMAGAG